jgi:hypothetical protein
MRLIALEIPDDAPALAGWLEGRLVGLDLAALVAELEAVHGPARKPFALEQVLGNRRDAVLTHGLEALPHARLRILLTQPRLLLELQELILVAGEAHWQQRAASNASGSESVEALERTWRRLESTLAGETAPPVPVPVAVPPPAARRWSGAGARWLVSLATAAAVLLAVIAVQRWPGRSGPGSGQPGPNVTAATGWGWDRPGALPQELPRRAYLDHLADAAHQWFNQRPETPLALAKRIGEFRQGCSVLILSPHRPLPAEDRAWLVEKCRAWAAKLDTHLAAVEAGQDPLEVRAEVDDTINRLIAALREKAGKPA